MENGKGHRFRVAILIIRNEPYTLWKVWLARYLQVITVPWNGVDGTRESTFGFFEYIAISLFLPPTYLNPYTDCLCVLHHTKQSNLFQTQP